MKYYTGMLTQPFVDPDEERRVRASDSVARAAKLGLNVTLFLVALVLGFMASNNLLPFQDPRG